MRGQEEAKEWLELAEMDFHAAEYLLDMRPVPVEIICYHCEQAAEKMLKGSLVYFHKEPPRTHDLVQLCKLCCELDDRFHQLIDSCIELTPYGVQVRYPAHLELDETDMENALRECRAIYEGIEQILNQDAPEE